MILKFKQYNENKDADKLKKYYVSLNDKDYNEISGKYYTGKKLNDIYNHLKYEYKDDIVQSNIKSSTILNLKNGNFLLIDLNYKILD